MSKTGLNSTAAADEYAEAETGPRHPAGFAGYLVIALCVGWSLFQLSIASFVTLDAFRVRIIHLGFALTLAYLVFPAWKKSPRDRIPRGDWALMALAAASVLYILLDYDGIRMRPGAPLGRDIIAGLVGITLLLEATRRSLGPALAVIAAVFIAYSFAGPWLPDIIAHKGYSLRRVVDHQFLTTEGVFGVALGVSASYVFLFVLFGVMLEKAGAGAYFIQLSYSLLGRFKGGPAKAAILASGFTGMVNGSSVSNTVTTGTFTIPLMKKAGYPPEKAAAIEVAASTDGQLMPPIMGAAAFIMAEFLGITYLDVVRAAIIPSIASFTGLLYISHLEADRMGLKGAPREELPPFFKTAEAGAHYLIPVAVLIASLVYYRHSPVNAAFNAIVTLMTIMVIQRPVKAYIDKAPVFPALVRAFTDIYEGLVAGARSMIGIAAATATAGIIVGAVTLTGFGMRVVEIVEIASMGYLLLMLIITGFASLIMGIGLPTTATYIVMATLTAPVIVTLGGDMGLVVPLIAAHMFVFYFGILADDTPPVGLCAYAAAGIAGADPVKTGLQSFAYDSRILILPFMFVTNTRILLVGVEGFAQGVMVAVFTIAGILAFISALQGRVITPISLWERGLVFAAAFMMLNPPLFEHYVKAPDESLYSVAGLALFAVIVGFRWKNSRASVAPGAA